MNSRNRNAAIIGLLIGVITFVLLSARSMKPSWWPGGSRNYTVPAPSANDAAEVVMTADGVPLTIKQRENAWLPGGQMKLHLDDITGRQVLISVTDASGKVILGPHSARVDERILIPPGEKATHEIEVVRLKNLLTGDDFGEFVVRPANVTPVAKK